MCVCVCVCVCVCGCVCKCIIQKRRNPKHTHTHTCIQGATLCLASRTLIVQDLRHALLTSRCTHVWATPALWGLLRGQPSDFPDLRVVGLGGEAISPATIELWSAAVVLVNNYGATEATVAQTTLECHPSIKPCVAGHVFRNVDLIVEGDLAREGNGVMGEIWIAGVQLAQGYLNRPALTEEKFIVRSFGEGEERNYTL